MNTGSVSNRLGPGESLFAALGARVLIGLLICLYITCAPASAEQAVKTGPAVGTVIPAFEAPDQHGQRRDLKSIVGPKGAMLVFFRSADW